MFGVDNTDKSTKKSKKRSHEDDRDREKDSKKAKVREDRKNDEIPESKLSSDMVKYFYFYYLVTVS